MPPEGYQTRPDKCVGCGLTALSAFVLHATPQQAGEPHRWARSFRLERGYTAFKHRHGAEGFLRTVEGREKKILDRIFMGKARPFEIVGL